MHWAMVDKLRTQVLLYRRWLQVDHTLLAVLWQTARPDTDAVLRPTWNIQRT